MALRSLGLSLDEVAAALSAAPHYDTAELVRRHLALVDEQIHRAAQVRTRLLRMLATLHALDCPTTAQFLDLTEESTTMNAELYDTIGTSYTHTMR